MNLIAETRASGSYRITVAVGTTIADRPRADPYERLRIRLLRRMRSGKLCRTPSLGHVFPALCRAHVRLNDALLRLRPSLPSLRGRLPFFVSAGSQLLRHSPSSPERSCPPFGLHETGFCRARRTDRSEMSMGLAIARQLAPDARSLSMRVKSTVTRGRPSHLPLAFAFLHYLQCRMLPLECE